MNERLKYRIWDKKAKSYTNSIGYPGASFHCVSNYYLSPNGEIVDFVTTIGGNQDDASKGPVDQDDYIVEFNTGMKDKNGVPIFEGDFIVGMFDFGPAGFQKHSWTVAWHNEHGYQWNYWDLSTIEVVGIVAHESVVVGHNNKVV
jgi:hypothetical protein